jgi:hypothetical protein
MHLSGEITRLARLLVTPMMGLLYLDIFKLHVITLPNFRSDGPAVRPFLSFRSHHNGYIPIYLIRVNRIDADLQAA